MDQYNEFVDWQVRKCLKYCVSLFKECGSIKIATNKWFYSYIEIFKNNNTQAWFSYFYYVTKHIPEEKWMEEEKWKEWIGELEEKGEFKKSYYEMCKELYSCMKDKMIEIEDKMSKRKEKKENLNG